MTDQVPDYDPAMLIELICQTRIETIPAGLPALVVKYDPETQKATVQPLIKYRDRSADFDDQGLKDMPVIQGVPIIHPSTGTAIVSFPVIEGETIVALMFCSRSIDTFTLSDGTKPVDPKDFRVFDVNDCYGIPGLYPFSKALGTHPSDLEIRMNSGTANEVKIALKPNGDLVITSPTKVVVNATDEVVVNTTKATVNAEDEVIVNTATATVNASDSVTIDSPQTTITGELRVDGGVSVGADVETDAGFSANTHVHLGNLSKPTGPFIP